MVARDGRLGEVIKQIIREHLYWQHRQEGQQHAGPEQAEHAAEIRAGAHLDVFDDVAEHLASFQDALLENQQVFFKQDDVGQLLGDVDGAVHRNADVRGLERETVIDAVAEKADDMAFRMQRGDDARLLFRRNFGENGDGFNQLRQFTVGHGFDFGAERKAIDRKTDVPTDFACHDFIVAGQKS